MRVRLANPEAVIIDPQTRRQLARDGGDVSDSTFWRRRLRDGDVVMVDEKEQEQPVEGDGPQPTEEPAEGEPVRPEFAPVAPLATRTDK